MLIKNRFGKLLRSHGAVTIVITMALLTASALATLFSGQFIAGEQKIYSGLYQNQQAYEAAEAGLAKGLVYLRKYPSIIIDENNDGYIDRDTHYDLQNITLDNGSSFSVNFINPIANDFSVLKITAFGKSADGKVEKPLVQLVRFYSQSYLVNLPQDSILVRNTVDFNGNAKAINLYGVTTIHSGGDVNFEGNARTITTKANPSSSRVNINDDVIQNDLAIKNMQDYEFLHYFFGDSLDDVNNLADTVMASASASTLNGKVDTTVLVNNSVNISGNFNMGCDNCSNDTNVAVKPVLLLVNGRLNLSGNNTIYGIIYARDGIEVSGNTTIHGALITSRQLDISGNVEVDGFLYATDDISASGNAKITGALAGGKLNASGNFTIAYDLSKLNQSSLKKSSYIKAIGGWNDF